MKQLGRIADAPARRWAILELAVYTGEAPKDLHPLAFAIDSPAMRRQLLLAGMLLALSTSTSASAQTILSQYPFNGDLLNSSTFANAPHGTFREGATVAGSVAGTAQFGRGVDGTVGGALRLDGIDDWIDVTTGGHPGQQVPGTSSTGPGLVSGTAMAWVRLDNTVDATPRWLMGNVNTANTQSYQFGWNGIRLESSASASVVNNKFTVTDSSATPNVAWADGEWHHIAASWDGFLNVGRVYVDGAQVGSNATGSSLGTGDQQAAWQLSMALGTRNNGGTLDGFWSGLVDDLRIYAGLLNNAQVQAIFNATTVAPDPTAGPADFDGNGTVDGGDFLIWQRGFGVGTTPAEGDADGNQAVDGADLAAWSTAFGQTVDGQGSLAAVPEPAGALLLAAAVCGLVGFRRR